MQFGNDNGMALSRQHIAALEKDARRMRKRRFSLSRRFSFDAFIRSYQHTVGMNPTKWQPGLTLAPSAD
jgi:hypothetical protein